MHPLQSEADISTERFRHSSIPTYPPPMLTNVDWVSLDGMRQCAWYGAP